MRRKYRAGEKIHRKEKALNYEKVASGPKKYFTGINDRQANPSEAAVVAS